MHCPGNPETLGKERVFPQLTHIMIRGQMEIDDSILQLPIANLARTADNIIRGETLWAGRNRRYLQAIKQSGI